MTWLSCAIHRPVPYSGLHARRPNRAALLHTNGGPTTDGDLFGWWVQCATGKQGAGNRHVGAHLQATRDGRLFQYADTDLVLYHAFGASEWSVGIETEDDGNPATPWTVEQRAAIRRALDEMGVPNALVASESGGDGVGWHSQFPSWNKSGHVCPGVIRRAQITDLLATQGDDIVTPDDMDAIALRVWAKLYEKDANKKLNPTADAALRAISAAIWLQTIGSGQQGATAAVFQQRAGNDAPAARQLLEALPAQIATAVQAPLADLPGQLATAVTNAIQSHAVTTGTPLPDGFAQQVADAVSADIAARMQS